ncbi:hypothetical protein [Halorussus salinisoli]|uniref:hypothetical protein n=1 Tax=Halorussus salinisoli TaxID=2558242 RepID=UPI0010C167DF|nr:hypothetical protein [Halorussus salinisoli]
MSENDTQTMADRRKVLTGVGVTALGGLAGCTGGNSSTNNQDTTTEEPLNLDFGGMSLNVTINTGKFAQSFQRWVIPRVEEKYNLNINAETMWTSQQTSKVLANRKNPPAAVMMGREGIHRLAKEDMLVPLSDHTDVVTNYSEVHDQFKWDDGHGVAYEIGEVDPLVVLGDGPFDSAPKSWDAMFKQSNKIALTPFAWSSGPQVLMMAAAIASDAEFGSISKKSQIDAGFQYLEENVAPKTTAIWKNAQQLKQLVASKSADAFVPWFDYINAHWLRKKEYEMMRRPKPAGIPYAQSVAVTKNNSKKKQKAALAYINEALAADFQTKASRFLVQGVTNKNAELAPIAKKIDVPTAETFSGLTYQNFEFMWANRSKWEKRWASIFK